MAAATCAIAVATLALLPASSPAVSFRTLDSSQIQGLKLYDLGAADFNDDGLLDVFTSNHKFDSSLLAGNGQGGFTDVLASSGFSPTPQFPGYEDIQREPDRTAPGLYLYATDRDQPRDPFHIAATGVEASGTVVFDAQDLQIVGSTNATVSTTTLPDGSTQLSFDADPGALIDVTVEHIDLPVRVSIDPPIDPAQIRVGADIVPATSRQFTLSLRDRHGYGFADLDGDLATDVFIATGGLGGEIVDPFFTGKQNDELLLARSGVYTSAIADSGLVKGVCRGRSVRVGDLDSDGVVDLLETCDGAPPQLYLGGGDGRFQPAAGPPVLGNVYRLADLGRDGTLELIATVGATVQTWSYADGAWALVGQVNTLNGESPPQTLGAGDIDGDGDLDLLETARAGNTILLNVDGKLRRRAPSKFGIPERGAFAGSFVDFDNDGDLDLDLVPKGLYESTEGSFERTDRLAYGPLPTGRISYALTSWPDLDGDGRRDFLSARGRGEFSAEQLVDMRLNTTRRTGHWLEVDLLGPPGNAQSTGANVMVRTDAGREYGWVGQSDDSRYSSGHYRIYFGLGAEKRIRKLVARWSDGQRVTRTDLRANRLLRIPHPDR